jgi:hypothetical protein
MSSCGAAVETSERSGVVGVREPDPSLEQAMIPNAVAMRIAILRMVFLR